MALLTLHLADQLAALRNRASLAPLSRFAVALAYAFMIWDERYRSRRALRELTEDQLEDVGLTRAQVTREAAKPFYWSCRRADRKDRSGR